MSLAQPGQAGQSTIQIKQYILGSASTTPSPPHLSLCWTCQVDNRSVSKALPISLSSYPPSWTCMNPSANQCILFLALDSHPSPGLSLNLSSNNPFRNRAASPSLSDGQRSPFDPPPRPVSRNPFLDASSTATFQQPRVGSPEKMSFATDSSAPRPALTGNAAELFVRHFILTVETRSPLGFD
jgi:hypothetical protein